MSEPIKSHFLVPVMTVDLEMDEPYFINRARAISEFEKVYVTNLLARHNGNVTYAAKAAHMDRKWLGDLIKRNGLQAIRVAVMDKPPVTQRSDV